VSDLDPELLELEDVFELHADSIARYGGDIGVRDRGLIESAVAVPRQSFGGAAAYACHIAESQAFVDGNKRAGLAAATAFLAMNGYDLIERDERLYTAMIALTTPRSSLDESGRSAVRGRADERAHVGGAPWAPGLTAAAPSQPISVRGRVRYSGWVASPNALSMTP
jgi:death-on-curing protein